MERIAEKLTNRLLLSGYIDAEQSEWCRYVLVRHYMDVLSFLVMTLVGMMIAGWRAAILFTTVFRFLRIRTGGYHAQTPHTCLLVSLCVQCAALLSAQCVHSRLFYGAVAILCACLVLRLAPANNAALHLTREELAATRIHVQVRAVVVLIGGETLLLLPNSLWGSCAVLALASDALLLVLSTCGFGVQ